MTGPVRENYREDVAGRANVEDTPELNAYYDELERFEAAALWTVANKIEPWEPKSESRPVLWRYADLRDHVLRSIDLVAAAASSISTIPAAVTSPPAAAGSIPACR